MINPAEEVSKSSESPVAYIGIIVSDHCTRDILDITLLTNLTCFSLKLEKGDVVDEIIF